MLVSIVIPTYNNEDSLAITLNAIQKQQYPKNKIEILICDGGSTDKTKIIASQFTQKIFYNKKRLGEYGIALGIEKAKGDLIMILAADNEPANKDFIKKMVTPFVEDKNIMLTFPKQVSSQEETWIARYMNTFTDPVNHFIYQYAANTRTFYKAYPVKKKTSQYVLYKFTAIDYPMLAFAQGTTIRKNLNRDKESYGDDLSPVISLIEQGYDLAYVPDALLIHHTTKYIKDFIRKQKWAVDNYLFAKNYGVRVRLQYFSQWRNFRKYFFAFYAASIILPILASFKGLIVDRQKEWIYHPFLTYVMGYILLSEIIRVKIVGDTKHIVRK